MALVGGSVRMQHKPPAVGLDPTLGVGTVRQISHIVRIGGVDIPTWKSWNKSEHAYSANSTLNVTMRLEETVDLFAIAQQLSEQESPVTIEVYTTIKIKGKVIYNNVLEFSGIVDTIDADYDNFEYRVSGKSYATLLLNEKVNEPITSPAYAPKSTSQVVEELVNKYGQGLKVVVKDHLGRYHFDTPVGKVYKDRRVKPTTDVSVWDLLLTFAREDGADLYVKGDTLYYVPKPTDKAVSLTELKGVTPHYTFTYPDSILSLSISHSPLQSHDITVTVTSYQPRTGKTYTATTSMSEAKINAIAKELELNPNVVAPLYAESRERMQSGRKQRPARVSEQRNSSTVKAARIARKEKYTFQVPNATQEDCARIAARIMKDISSKEFIVNLTALAQPDMNPRQYIGLQGTKSKVTDQVYAIKQINVSSSLSDSGDASGYIASFVLVNHDVQSMGGRVGDF